MHVIIIGNGVAGNSAAESLRQANPQAKITLISEEPSSEYSACVLCDYISGELPRRRVFLKKKNEYSKLNVEVWLGKKVETVDPLQKRIIVEGRSYPYDKLILATGSEAMVPPIKGVQKRGVFTLKTLKDAEAISRHKGKRAVIIGSGPIGIEATVALKKKGYEIHMIELLDWILPRLLDEECARIAADILHQNGVKVIVGERVNEIYGKRSVEGISTDHRQIPCDTVILSAGAKPRTELVALSGIPVGRSGGIQVNTRMETSQPDIYACGDCAEVMVPGTNEGVSSLLWQIARRQGEIAGWNSAGKTRDYSIPMNSISLKVFDTYIASISHPKYVTDQRYEKIDKRFEDVCWRMVLDDGVIRSVQAIGKSDEMGIFSSLIKKEVKIGTLRKVTGLEEAPSLFPWYEKIRHYIY